MDNTFFEAFPKVKIAKSVQRDLTYQDKQYVNPNNTISTYRVKVNKEGNKRGVYMAKTDLPKKKKTFEEFMIEVAAWQRKEGKSKSGGLNEKGRKSYEKENPGSDLKAPSKKVGNPRRASFCARMSGMKKKLTSKKTANDPNSRINKSLRAWNC